MICPRFVFMDCLDNRGSAKAGPSVLYLLLFCVIFGLLNESKLNYMHIKVGQKAPDFTLYDTEKQTFTLSEWEGKKNILILFFPMAFTGVCTKELCSIRDQYNHYNTDHLQVIGISVDSVFSLQKFKEEQHYQFPLLSDFNKTVSTAYGCIYESFTPMDMKGVSKRSAFLIDKKGLVQYAEVLENAGDLPDFEAIDKKITELSSFF